MRKLFLCLLVLCAVCVRAQVSTSPAIIEPGYTGQIIITFDPNKGNKGMVGATQCYAHTGYCTAQNDWLGVVGGSWRSPSAPKLTATGDGKWQLVINNMYTFYNIPEGTEVTALAFVFHDGPGGSKEGKTASGGDIFIYLGEDNSDADIWDAVAGLTPTTKARPSGVDNGIYYDPNDPTKVTLCTYAASKSAAAKRVFLLGDMTNWKLDAEHQLYKDGNYFWITLTGLEPGKEYRFQYAVERSDGVKKQISDLYSEKVIHPDDKYEPRKLDPTLIDYPKRNADGYVTVIQTQKPQFPWSDATLNFKRPNKNNLVIYELWVYDYTASRAIEGVRQRLDYLQQLGVNAIELMPICEFDGNYNWGYSPNHYFAPDRAYGSENDIKTFIDECHQHGMAVILDMVFNHATGLNPMNKLYPYGTELSQNPWFNVTAPHSDNVYEDWNHGFEPAHKMFIRALQYWLTEYKVDGYRLDLSHGLCSDQAGTSVGNLKDYYSKGVKAVSPDAYMILEHWGDKMGDERPQLVNEGMMCWNNVTNAYCQTAMGWLKEGDSFTTANQDNYVSYCESHDEERMQYKAKMWGNGSVKTDLATRIGRVPENVAFNVLLNGPHMMWQFEEIGYDFSINSEAAHPDGDKSDYRCNIKPRPEPLGYFRDPYRVAAYTKCAQLIQLRTRLLPDVFAGDPTDTKIYGGLKLRSIQWGSEVYVVANFDVSASQTATLPSGTWYDYFAGGTQAASSYSLQPGELKIFTGRQLELPVINQDLESMLPIENVATEEAPKAYKFLRDGQVLILRGNQTYNIQGQLVR